MIKKLNALKSKRGFTLVELIVVIAIIAVLAALITPVMMGYVESANVQSANNTAAKICQFVNNFLLTCDVEERGMKLSPDCTAVYKITINGTSWTFESEGTFDSSAFRQDDVPWEGRTSKPISQAETNIECAEDQMALLMAESFPPVKDASAWVYLEGGKCLYCWYARGSVSANVPVKDDFAAGVYAWNGSKDGINTDGAIVGTYPPLLMTV
ncbi:MAG: type II secretion system GspH family protein [Oscillospiraceae bacterium]|nr:type II secretion system GspH family protein [Oscillospiraceae bacterium]